MALKKSFFGRQVVDFLKDHGGMPSQATPVKRHSAAKGFDYDCFRFACDDYMRGVWRSSPYRESACKDRPIAGCFKMTLNRLDDRPREGVTKSRKRIQASAFITQDQIEFLMGYQFERCPCCEAILTKCGYHVDHIMPVKLGGTNDPWNIQLLCQGCNLRKSAHNPYAWAQSHGIELPSYFTSMSPRPDESLDT